MRTFLRLGTHRAGGSRMRPERSGPRSRTAEQTESNWWVRQSDYLSSPGSGILRIALARQSLLNPFERRRGLRDGALAMWKVRRWRAYEGTISEMPVVEPAVPARAAVAVGT